MPSEWTEKELLASVEAYVEMRELDLEGESFSKVSYYRELASQHNRSEGAFEYRIRNISRVYELLGRPWVSGLKPARNVGSNVLKQLQSLIAQVEGQHASVDVYFESRVAHLRDRADLTCPSGILTPKATAAETTNYERDPRVAAWVLQQSQGSCECCGEPAPFKRGDGSPYLEVHHVTPLADGGPDTVNNVVAVCPNCHRKLHYGRHKEQLVNDLIDRIPRLEPPE